MDNIITDNSPFPKRGEMVSLIQQNVKKVKRTETVGFSIACGRICTEDVYSNNTLPNCAVSRFDGIAVRYDDFEKGPPDTSGWVCGREYEFCNTGIAMPDGFDTVIAIEDVTIHDIGIEVHEQPEFRGEMVGGAGASLLSGERLIARGEVVAPAHVGLLAAGGVSEVCVYAKPRVAIIPTGDELVPHGGRVPKGKNVDSNSHMIAAYLTGWGAEPVMYPIVRDDPGAIIAALEVSLSGNDAVIIIAGSSLGTKDYTIKVLHSMGEVIVPELAHGPGRKSSLSVVGGKPVLGVAGPPLGAQITCDLYLAPFVSALRGLPHVEMRQLEVICDDSFVEHDVDFCERVFIYKSSDSYHIRSGFSRRTTRPQMQALSNGNFYRIAGTSCEVGDTAMVELLVPIEYLPDKDLLPEILGDCKE